MSLLQRRWALGLELWLLGNVLWWGIWAFVLLDESWPLALLHGQGIDDVLARVVNLIAEVIISAVAFAVAVLAEESVNARD